MIKIKTTISLLLLLSILTQCKNDMKPKEDKDSFPTVINSNVIEYEISECKRDCRNEPNNIISSSIKNDTVTLQLGLMMNCVWMEGATATVNYESNDTIDIKLIPSYDGAYGCMCYFYHDIKIIKLNKIPSTILINSKDVSSNNTNWQNQAYTAYLDSIYESSKKEN